MIHKLLVTFVAAFFTLSTAAAAPALSDAYAAPGWRAQPALSFDVPAAEQAVVRATSPAPASIAPPDAMTMRMGRDRYTSGRRMHINGNIMALAGGLATGPLAILTLGAAWNDSSATTPLAVMTVGAAATAVTGTVLSSVGALRAVNGVNMGLGTALPNSLGIAGVVLVGAGWLSAPTGLGLVAVPVGLVCGALQMRAANQALAQAGLVDLQVMPTRDGFAVAGRF